MKGRSFLILISMCALCVGYAIFDYWSDSKKEISKSEAAQLLKLDKDQINEVTFQRAENSFKLQRTSEGWKLVEPLQEVADQKAVVDFVEGTTLEKSVDLVKEGADIDWKVFGLSDPLLTLSFKDNAGASVGFAISAKKNFAGDYYLRKVGEDKVYTASATWFTRTQKRILDFRDRRVLKYEPAIYKTMHYLIENKTLFMAEKKASEWSFTKGPSEDAKNWILDSARVNEILFSLNNLQALEVILDTDAKALQQRGLKKVSVALKLNEGAEKAWSVEFYENPQKEVYALTTEPARLLKISPSDFTKIKNQTAENLRDRKLAFVFDKDLVTEVSVEAQLLSAKFIKSKSGDQWNVDKPEAQLTYKPESIAIFLNSLKNLQILDFNPPASVSYPVEKYNVKLSDKDAKKVLELSVNGTYEKNKSQFFRLHSSLFPQDFGMEATGFKNLPWKDLVQKKEKAP
jgi:hypothetical protein